MPKDIKQEKFDKENEELFEMIGFNKSSEEKKYKNKLEEVMSRITPKKKKRPQIICQNFYGKVLLVKSSDGSVIAHMSLGDNLKKHVRSKIELDAYYEPVFVLMRNNEDYLKVNVMKQEGFAIKTNSTDEFQEIKESIKSSKPMLEDTKNIFGLIEAKNYDEVDVYITDYMAELINNNDMESTSIYSTLLVRFRDIQRVKSALQNKIGVTPIHQELYNQLDILYRNICETIINSKNYNQNTITRG